MEKIVSGSAPAKKELPLYKFAHCHKINEKLNFLANGLAADEYWGGTDKNGNLHPILYNYIHHTFKRLEEEHGRIEENCDCIEGKNRKICVSDNGSSACFDTGLYTENYEPIYGLFTKNKVPAKQPWYLKGFYKSSAKELTVFFVLPQRAEYFENASDLIYDPRLEIRVNVDHILDDDENRKRIPESILQSVDLVSRLEGALSIAKKKVAANYRLAIPQFREGKIQLLIPLSLGTSEPNLALAVSKYGSSGKEFYRGHTCLDLDMAYNNARLIAKPDSNWLQAKQDT